MKKEALNIKSIKSYWVEEAEEAISVAEHLFEKEDYSYALFFGHLAIEKRMKALYVSLKGEHAPPIHNLPRLARLAGLSLEEKQKENLILISSFNIEARYPDLKSSFRKKCTKEYAAEQINIIKETFEWLKKLDQ